MRSSLPRCCWSPSSTPFRWPKRQKPPPEVVTEKVAKPRHLTHRLPTLTFLRTPLSLLTLLPHRTLTLIPLSPPHTDGPTTPPPTHGPTHGPTHSPNTEAPWTATVIEGGKEYHVTCTQEGPMAHPGNVHKYIICEYQADHKHWHITVMPCAIGTRWHQAIKNCIQDN
nr:Tyr p 12 allergen [Tyrophagus putrescentiae]